MKNQKKHSDTNNLTLADYRAMYQQSLHDPKSFWAEQAERFVSWFTSWDTVLTGDFKHVNMQWFSGATLNVCYNCVDRHVEMHPDKVAIIWEGDEPNESKKITYRELYEQVCVFANVLKKRKVKKGDRVCIYMPMIPEAAIAMLACTRIGAIHSVVFGGFSADALSQRILDAECSVVITADEAIRGGKHVDLKKQTDKALKNCPDVHSVIVVKHSSKPIPWNAKTDVWLHEISEKVSADCPPEAMNAEDPLFILYTSGSTGKPKGVLHTTGGYLVYAAMTHKMIFNVQDDDIYWCTADVGWITGHSYIVYGPLANGTTTLMFAGVPHYPTVSRFWEIIDKHQVSIFYTAPTAIRALMREGDEAVTKTSRRSLKLLGSVGEPINPEVWQWYHDVVGNGECPVVDTWWQTETGGIMLSPIPGVNGQKPGAACWPFFGVAVAIVDDTGNVLEGTEEGQLVITQPWPGQMRSVYGDHDRFVETYFSKFPGMFFTGDGAHRDADGDYWITGRIDDVINVSGHRFATAEIESAIVKHPAIAEAAVVGFPHDIKGQGIYAFVTPKVGIAVNDDLKKELIEQVRESIGPFAKPDCIHWADALPKTRSGKIMRRILRKIASNELDNLGDTSTLADPGVIAALTE